jgi:uncharacterized glyoxalase superfamily protein PhnB
MPGQPLQRGNDLSTSLHRGGRFGALTDRFGVSWLFNNQFQQQMT